ncbi:hypothetical protein HNQ36_003455 [Afipia massiliensis]|uniref:Uncharacterized protein n=1 Tax=Afipia massiliensis TaxID=211460 RepID=A0A840N4B8_9BRAD|nr:hypothetical protein [Afipia massiliensis]MBB5053464.1 hypothetical protein [Afipia massiliensis]
MSQGFENPELLCLIALRDAREWFQNEILAGARAHDTAKVKPELDAEDLDLLRGNEAFQIAEFYYLLQQYRLAAPERIRPFLLRHNADMQALVKNKEKRDALGLSVSRLEDGIFSDTQIEKVVQQISDGRLRLDQADLGRLLCSLMSVENTRKSVVALAKGGWLNRIKIGHVLIVSVGRIEACFEQHLRRIVEGLRPAIKDN